MSAADHGAWLSFSGEGLTAELDPSGRRLRLVGPTGTLTSGDGLEVTLQRGAGPLTIAEADSWEARCAPDRLELSVMLRPVPARIRVEIRRPPSSRGLLLHIRLDVLEPIRMEGCRVGLRLAGGSWDYACLADNGRLTAPVVLKAPCGALHLGHGPMNLFVRPVDSHYWTARLSVVGESSKVDMERPLPHVGDSLNLQPATYFLFGARLSTQSEPGDPTMAGWDRTRPGYDYVVVLCPPWQTLMPPLWPAMLAAIAREAGLRGGCIDANTLVARRLEPSQLALWEMNRIFRWRKREAFETVWGLIKPHMHEVARRVAALQPGVLGLCTTEANLRCSVRLAELVKDMFPATKVVVGGPGVYWTTRHRAGGRYPVTLFDHWTRTWIDEKGVVDVFLRGEADDTFPELVRRLRQDMDPLVVPGTLLQRGDLWFGSVPPVRPEALDRLPFPAYDDLHLPSYKSTYAPILFSRGCPNRCAFCNDCVLQGPFRWRSGDHLFAEVEQLHRRYRIRGLNFVDLLVNGNPRQLARFCDRIIESGIELEWSGQALADASMTPALLEKMARAGCFELTFGVESLSSPVVAAMHKRAGVEQTLAVLAASRRVGIDTAINLLVGFPGETPEMFEESLRLLEQHREVISRIQAINECTLSRCSALWKTPEDFGVQNDGPDYCHGWYTEDGNDHAERTRRLQRAIELARRLDLAPEEVNEYDEGETAELSASGPCSQFVEI